MTRTNSLIALVLSLAFQLGANAELIKVPGSHITIDVGESTIKITKTLYDHRQEETGELAKRLTLCGEGATCKEPGQICHAFHIVGGGNVKGAQGREEEKQFQLFYVCANSKPEESECVDGKTAPEPEPVTPAQQRPVEWQEARLGLIQRRAAAPRPTVATTTTVVTSPAAEGEVEARGLCGFSESITLHKLYGKYNLGEAKTETVRAMVYVKESGPFAPCTMPNPCDPSDAGAVCRAYGPAKLMTCQYVGASEQPGSFMSLCLPADVNSSEKLGELGLQTIDQDVVYAKYCHSRQEEEGQYQEEDEEHETGNSPWPQDSLIRV